MITLRKGFDGLTPISADAAEWFNSLKHGEAIQVKQLHVDIGTDSQNRQLWAWNNQIQGYMQEMQGQYASAEQWHDILVSKLMPCEVKNVQLPDSESTYRVGRMRWSKMNKKERAEYLHKLVIYWAELGLVLEAL